jgi:uncharacterized coiled-coil protein SlyX
MTKKQLGAKLVLMEVTLAMQRDIITTLRDTILALNICIEHQQEIMRLRGSSEPTPSSSSRHVVVH